MLFNLQSFYTETIDKIYQFELSEFIDVDKIIYKILVLIV